MRYVDVPKSGFSIKLLKLDIFQLSLEGPGHSLKTREINTLKGVILKQMQKANLTYNWMQQKM